MFLTLLLGFFATLGGDSLSLQILICYGLSDYNNLENIANCGFSCFESNHLIFRQTDSHKGYL